MQWPPDYTNILKNRLERLKKIMKDDDIAFGALDYYSTRPGDFIQDWCITYDPRNVGGNLPAIMPFIMFNRQVELVNFLNGCMNDSESGLIEKCRDMGATWVCCAFSVWLWRFVPGSAIGWGSRKESLVDKIGDPDSIFEKLRMTIYNIPRFFWPPGFNMREHCSYMKIINPDPASKSTITGEAGTNIGRGGRKSIFFKDEALPVHEKIMTPGGWVKNGLLKVGDFVVSEKGKPSKITHINDCGFQKTYKMTFNDGTFLYSSPNHLWSVRKKIGKKEILVLRTKEIYKDFKYIPEKSSPQYRYEILNCEPVEFEKKEYYLHPYVLGALLGDGNVSQVPDNCAKITTKNKNLSNKISSLLPENVILSTTNNIEHRIVDKLNGKGNNHRSRARQLIVASGIAGKLAHDKYIPDNYLYGCIEDRWSLLNGLMDTDGSASNNGLPSYHTSSILLAENIRFLGESLGASVTMDVKKDKREYKDQYVLFFKFKKGVNPFSISPKKDCFKERKNTHNRVILNVEEAFTQKSRCITIDNETGLYLTKHCIPTHNSAHYEQAEVIESALGDNTNVQIDISSVKGTGTVFARRREAGQVWEPEKKMQQGRTRVFIMDWRDHPNKDQKWYDLRRKKAKDEGLLHVFAQEVDRDYSSSVRGIVIPGDWVNAAIDAHIKLDLTCDGAIMVALDVADEGQDSHALTKRKGILLNYSETWAQGDGGEAARKTISLCKTWRTRMLNYDAIGVGATVKAEINRVEKEGEKFKFVIAKWIASESPFFKNERIIPNDNESPKNKDFFCNLKAQGWWQLGMRFEKTYKAVEYGEKFPEDELISIDSRIPNLHQIKKELSQPTIGYDSKLKMLINKKPEGTASPNIADSIMMNYWPVIEKMNDFSALSLTGDSTWRT